MDSELFNEDFFEDPPQRDAASTNLDAINVRIAQLEQEVALNARLAELEKQKKAQQAQQAQQAQGERMHQQQRGTAPLPQSGGSFAAGVDGDPRAGPSGGWRGASIVNPGTSRTTTSLDRHAHASFSAERDAGMDTAIVQGLVAAQRFAGASGTVKSVGRRGQNKAPVDLKLKHKKIWLLPFRGHNLDLKGPDKRSVKDGVDIEVFLHNQKCTMSATGMKRGWSSAEIMDHIITHYQKAGFDLVKYGFIYATVRGKSDTVVTVDCKPSDMDGEKFQQEYGNERCVILINTAICPQAFIDYFGGAYAGKLVPEVHSQPRNTLRACEYCGVHLPESYACQHDEICERKMSGKAKLPGRADTTDGVKNAIHLDYTDPLLYAGDVSGIQDSDDFPIPAAKDVEGRRRHRVLEGQEWRDARAWCVCKGVGCKIHSKISDWTECANAEQWPIRNFHTSCVKAMMGSDFEVDNDWVCPICVVIVENENKDSRKKRRLNRSSLRG